MPLSYYQSHKASRLESKRRYRQENKTKIAAAAIRYLEEHPEYMKQYAKRRHEMHPRYNAEALKRWSKANPEKRRANRKNDKMRRRGAVGRVTGAEIQTIFGTQESRCAYCGEQTTLTIDHIVPVASEGTHTISNIVGACVRCNRKKHARTLEEFTGITPDQLLSTLNRGGRFGGHNEPYLGGTARSEPLREKI